MGIACDDKSTHRLRITGAFCALAGCTLGFVYGCSPLVLPVAMALAGTEDKNIGGTMEGGYFLYGTSLLLILFNALAFVVSCWLPSKPLAALRATNLSLVMWPLGLACISAAVQWKRAPLLLVGFAILALPLAVIDLYLCHIELPRAWDETNVHKGMSCLGFSIGLGAIFWCLMAGELAHHFGAAVALWVIATTQAIILASIHLLLHPTLLFSERLRNIPCVASSDLRSTSSSTLCDGTLPDAKCDPTGLEGPPIGNIAQDWRVWVFCYIICGMTFCGRSIKMLISVIFEQALDMTYLDAVHVSAAYLGLYCLGRGLTPLLAVGDRIYLLYGTVLACESVAYAATPWSLSLDSNREPVYILLRLFSGGGFAVLLGNLAVLSVRTFGLTRNHEVFSLLMTVEWISGAGPSIAWALHVLEVLHGRPATQSYNTFFFVCAGIAASASVGVAVLRNSRIILPDVALREEPNTTVADMMDARHRNEDECVAELTITPEDVRVSVDDDEDAKGEGDGQALRSRVLHSGRTNALCVSIGILCSGRPL